MSVRALQPETMPPAAFARLTSTKPGWPGETHAHWRSVWGYRVVMLVSFGELPYFRRHLADYGGLTGFDVKVPTLAAMVIAGHAVMGLSLSLAAPAVVQFCLVTAELSIAGVARASTLPVFTAAAYFPLLFFSGLWIPIAQMPSVLQRIAAYTPVGAAVQAIQDSMQGTFPPARPLAVMAAWALVFAPASRRFFRWE